MGRHGNAEEADPARLIQYSTSDIIIAFTPAPTLCSCSSFSHAHRFMFFFRNQTFALVAHSARTLLTIVYLSEEQHLHQHPPHAHVPRSRIHTGSWVYFSQPNLCPCGSRFCENSFDYSVSVRRVAFTPAPTPCSCSSLSHAHRFMFFFSQPNLFPCGSRSCETSFDCSVSDSKQHLHQHPPHAHAPRSRMHTSSWFFSHNQAFALVAHSARPIDYSVSGRRVAFTPAPMLMLVALACTQVHGFFSRNQTGEAFKTNVHHVPIMESKEVLL